MLLIDAYMNLHYAVSKVWSQNFTLFAFMTLFGKNVLFFRLEVLIAHVFVGLKVLIAHVLVGLDRSSCHTNFKARNPTKNFCCGYIRTINHLY